MIDGGVALGLENDVAQTLALQTMLGTATVLQASDGTISDFIKAVTSAKGTTAEGLAVLEKSAVKSTMKRTLAAAARRSKELSKI
jgi:pyrroline-5-carboxylate reductase